MKISTLILMITGLVLIGLNGCAPLLIGTGAAGGVALSVDTIRLERNISYENAWNATMETLSEIGSIRSAEKQRGKIEAQVNEATITVLVSKQPGDTMAMDVTARKKGLPALQMAETVADRINSQIRKK